jgi:hypothetical protein
MGQYAADRGDPEYALRLGKMFYHGSLYQALGGAAASAASVATSHRRTTISFASRGFSGPRTRRTPPSTPRSHLRFQIRRH